MNNDTYLLRMAAKSSGNELPITVFANGSHIYGFERSEKNSNGIGYSHCTHSWNPLEDDGDALRLANQLSMSVEISEHEESTYAYVGKDASGLRLHQQVSWNGNKDAATRLAIVMVAAKVGELV